jgi:hypothetical protein
MLIAVTALLFQFSLFSSQPNQAADKVTVATVWLKQLAAAVTLWFLPLSAVALFT